MREYRYYRYRYGYSGSADYKFNDVSSIFVRGFYSQLKDWATSGIRAGIDPADDHWVYPSTSANSPSPSSILRPSAPMLRSAR